MMNYIRDNITHKDKDWRKGNEKKPKKEIVIEYLKNNPDLNPTQIARNLGVSKPKVYKYLKESFEN